MKSRRYLYNPLFEDDTIQTFGETPGIPATKDEVEKAEEESEEIQEEKEEANKPEPDEDEKESTEGDIDMDLGDDSGESEASDTKDESDEDASEDENDSKDEEPEDTPASKKEAKDNDLDEGATKNDSELCWMTEHELDCLRFFKSHMEYGTPSGGDDPSTGCNGCEDAADAVIIDAEVAPSEGSGRKDTENQEEGSGDFGDMGGGEDEGDDDFGGDLEMYYSLRVEYIRALKKHRQMLHTTMDFTAEELPGLESFTEKLLTALGFIGKKMVKYTRKAYLFCRGKLSKVFLRTQTVNKLWKFKLSRGINKVDLERLGNYEVEAFPFETWMGAAKASLACFDLVKNAPHIISAPDTEAISSEMERFADDLANIGIKMDLTKNKVDYNELMDQRQHSGVLDLGFTKQQIPNVIRYFGEIARRVPKGDLNNLEKICDKCREDITKFATDIHHQTETGRLRKGSQEYQEATDALLAKTVRYDFVLTTMVVAYYLFDRCSGDAQRVFSKFEDAMSFSMFVD